jgi:hypothetical protein
MSIECWIKPDHLGPVGGAGRPIVEWDNPATIGVVFWFEANYTLFADIKDTAGVDQLPTVGAQHHQHEYLQHVAVTYDKASGNGFLYINGVQVTNANFGNITPQTTFPLYLGKRAAAGFPGSGDLWNGLLDEPAIYSRALSPCEISAIYNAGTAGKQAVLASSTNTAAGTSALPYADFDQDGIPDFWEITLNESATMRAALSTATATATRT